MPTLVLVHGAVTGPSVWNALLPYLEDFDVLVPERPRTGSLEREVTWLADTAAGSWVVGLSGGATLGLALASTGVPLAGAVLHEPAVGSLAPGLLAPMAAAFADGGVEAFGTTLYGPGWSSAMSPDAAAAAAPRELAMFRNFEAAPIAPPAGRVLVTYGGDSSPARHEAAIALQPLGYTSRRIDGVRHFAPHDHPEIFARTLRSHLEHE